MRNLALVSISLVLGFAVGVYWEARHETVTFASAYQAVALDNGSAFFGKLHAYGTSHPYLTDVFYVQTAVNPEGKQQTAVLVKRGKEWHGPDKMTPPSSISRNRLG